MSDAKKKPRKTNWKKLGLELLVVFLGVTGGFLLNNWRTQQLESDLEQKYLAGFLKDVDSNISELQAAIKQDSVWFSRATPLLTAAKDDSLVTDSASAIMKLILGVSKADVHKGTYSDIINSGNLNLLSDFDLKSDLVDHHLKIEGVEFVDEYLQGYFADHVMPFVLQEYDLLAEQVRDTAIARDPRFTNVFTAYYAVMQQRRAAYKDLLADCMTLKVGISEEH